MLIAFIYQHALIVRILLFIQFVPLGCSLSFHTLKCDFFGILIASADENQAAYSKTNGAECDDCLLPCVKWFVTCSCVVPIISLLTWLWLISIAKSARTLHIKLAYSIIA